MDHDEHLLRHVLEVGGRDTEPAEQPEHVRGLRGEHVRKARRGARQRSALAVDGQDRRLHAPAPTGVFRRHPHPPFSLEWA
jgi:hypothetical protein